MLHTIALNMTPNEITNLQKAGLRLRDEEIFWRRKYEQDYGVLTGFTGNWKSLYATEETPMIYGHYTKYDAYGRFVRAIDYNEFVPIRPAIKIRQLALDRGTAAFIDYEDNVYGFGRTHYHALSLPVGNGYVSKLTPLGFKAKHVAFDSGTMAVLNLDGTVNLFGAELSSFGIKGKKKHIKCQAKYIAFSGFILAIIDLYDQLWLATCNDIVTQPVFPGISKDVDKMTRVASEINGIKSFYFNGYLSCALLIDLNDDVWVMGDLMSRHYGNWTRFGIKAKIIYVAIVFVAIIDLENNLLLYSTQFFKDGFPNLPQTGLKAKGFTRTFNHVIVQDMENNLLTFDFDGTYEKIIGKTHHVASDDDIIIATKSGP
jgi:hypothetical protein